jgi:hypothetical protein
MYFLNHEGLSITIEESLRMTLLFTMVVITMSNRGDNCTSTWNKFVHFQIELKFSCNIKKPQVIYYKSNSEFFYLFGLNQSTTLIGEMIKYFWQLMVLKFWLWCPLLTILCDTLLCKFPGKMSKFYVYIFDGVKIFVLGVEKSNVFVYNFFKYCFSDECE